MCLISLRKEPYILDRDIPVYKIFRPTQDRDGRIRLRSPYMGTLISEYPENASNRSIAVLELDTTVMSELELADLKCAAMEKGIKAETGFAYDYKFLYELTDGVLHAFYETSKYQKFDNRYTFTDCVCVDCVIPKGTEFWVSPNANEISSTHIKYDWDDVEKTTRKEGEDPRWEKNRRRWLQYGKCRNDILNMFLHPEDFEEDDEFIGGYFCCRTEPDMVSFYKLKEVYMEDYGDIFTTVVREVRFRIERAIDYDTDPLTFTPTGFEYETDKRVDKSVPANGTYISIRKVTRSQVRTLLSPLLDDQTTLDALERFFED